MDIKFFSKLFFFIKAFFRFISINKKQNFSYESKSMKNNLVFSIFCKFNTFDITVVKNDNLK